MSYTAYQNNKDSREPKAKAILEQYLGYKYLEICDSPDITDHKTVGIEVVNALPNDEIKELSKQEEEAVINKRLVQLKSRTYPCDLYSNSKNKIWVERDLLKCYEDRFTSKIEKLNRNYSIYLENDLFMFGNRMEIDNNVCSLLIQKFNNLMKGYEHKFDKVFIYDYGTLYILNLKTYGISDMKVTNDSELEIYSLNEFNNRTHHKEEFSNERRSA